MKLDEVKDDVAAQLKQQSELGVKIVPVDDVPETGPANRGVWYQIANVTAVFADLDRSTELSASNRPEKAAFAYTHFVRAMAVSLERFSAQYVDIHGDGVFGLFSGSGSMFNAAACAITMRTLVETEVAPRFQEDASSDWDLTAGIGIDRGTLLVRRLGLRGTKQNEVWAGKPLNMAAKLSSQADSNQVIVSDRMFRRYEQFSELRRRVLFWTCGCSGSEVGAGLDAPIGTTTYLWSKEPTPQDSGFDFLNLHRLKSKWCDTHGAAFCEALITGQKPGG